MIFFNNTLNNASKYAENKTIQTYKDINRNLGRIYTSFQDYDYNTDGTELLKNSEIYNKIYKHAFGNEHIQKFVIDIKNNTYTECV